jgi:hypothetical protein
MDDNAARKFAALGNIEAIQGSCRQAGTGKS